MITPDLGPLRPLDAIELLKIEHRRLNQLFVDYFAARSEERRLDLRPVICKAVRLHLSVEASTFFPALAQAADDARLLSAAATEYAEIMGALDGFEYPDPGAYVAADDVQSIAKMIGRHVSAAEGHDGFFARALQCAMDCEAVGHAVRRRKHELATVLRLRS